MWSLLSLDPAVSQVMSRNKFDSLFTFLHIMHEDEEKLKEQGDKLHEVRPLYNFISTTSRDKCR